MGDEAPHRGLGCPLPGSTLFILQPPRKPGGFLGVHSVRLADSRVTVPTFTILRSAMTEIYFTGSLLNARYAETLIGRAETSLAIVATVLPLLCHQVAFSGRTQVPSKAIESPSSPASIAVSATPETTTRTM